MVAVADIITGNQFGVAVSERANRNTSLRRYCKQSYPELEHFTESFVQKLGLRFSGGVSVNPLLVGCCSRLCFATPGISLAHLF